MFDQRERRPFLPVGDPDVNQAPGEVHGHVDILELLRFPTVSEPVDILAQREAGGGGTFRTDGDRQSVVALPGDTEGDDALSFLGARLAPERTVHGREVQQVESAGIPFDEEPAGTDDVRAFTDVQEHGGELLPEGHAGLGQVAGRIHLPGPGIEGVGLGSRRNPHVAALRKGFPIAGTGRKGQHPFRDRFRPKGAGLFDADPVPEQPVVSPAQQFRFAGRVGVGEGDLQEAGTRAAVFLDRAGRAGRKEGQTGGNEQSVHGSGGFSNVVDGGPVVLGSAEGDVDGAGFVQFRVQGSQLPDDGLFDEVGSVALRFRQRDGVVVRPLPDLCLQDEPRPSPGPGPGAGVQGLRQGIRVEIEDMFLAMGATGCDGDVQAGLGQEPVHALFGMEAHPIVPRGGGGQDVLRRQIASIAGFPVAVGQVDAFQTEGKGGEVGVLELDGNLPDTGLAYQPVHADPLHASVPDGHGDGPAAGHHQPPGRVVAEGGCCFGEYAGLREAGRIERRRGIDHGKGRVVARQECLPDR